MTIPELYSYIRLKVRSLACRIKALEDGTVAADGNGIYSANGSVANNRTVTLLGILNFLGAGVGREFYIEIGNGVDTFTQMSMEFDSMVVGYTDAGETNTITFNTNGTTVSGFLNLATYTPSSAADAAGVVGSMCRDDSFVYCKSASGWERIATTLIP